MEVAREKMSTFPTRNLKSFDCDSENRLNCLYSLIDNSSYARKVSSLDKELSKTR